MVSPLVPQYDDTDLDLSKLNRETILQGVEDVVEALYSTGDIQFAVSVLNAFEKFSDISGFARAKLLWAGKKWFTETGQTGDFYEKFGVNEKNEKTYTDRLIHLWDAIQGGKIPENIHKNRKVRELLPISEALAQGYVISEDVWKKLGQALDMAEIGSIIQKAKGKQPKKSAITLTVNDRGFITAWQDGQPHHAGTLNYADMETDDVVRKAVLRIKGGRAIIKDEQ